MVVVVVVVVVDVVVDVVLEVLVVVGDGGPDETIRVTPEFGGTEAPAPGSDPITTPAWYCVDV